MGKLKFLLARIAGLNWKQMFRKIDEVHEKSGRSKLFIFFDMVWCGLRYQAGYMDYWLFEMYDLNAAQRKTVLTRGINNGFIKAYNDPAYMPEIENKLKFAHNFSEFLHRDWLDYSTASDAELDGCRGLGVLRRSRRCRRTIQRSVGSRSAADGGCRH